MKSEELRQLLRKPEGLKLDFKRRYAFDHADRAIRDGQWDEFIKDVLALANGNVGVAEEQAHLIIGIGDALKADGTRDVFDVGDLKLPAQSILEKVNAACNPPLPNINCDMVLLDGCRIVVVSIPPSPHLHETTRMLKTSSGTVYSNHTVFVRRAEGIYPASASERQAILADKQSTRLPTVALDRLDVEKPRFAQDLIREHIECLALVPRYARWANELSDESHISSEAIRLPLFASPYDDIGGPSEELLGCIRSYERLLVLGEPGMGKTVALERAMWEFSTSASAVVPVFVPLIQYDGDLTSTIISALNETGVLNVVSGAEAEKLVRDHRCTFLFDGLNEVAGDHRSKLYAQLSSFMQAHPSSYCIITSRSHDTLWRRFHSREMIEDAVVVRRITDEQITEYLIAHLGERRGQELYDRLNQALRGLARIPLLLWLIKEAGLAGEELPGNRGELFDRFVRQVLKREQKQPDWATIPAQQKMQALSRLALYLQQRHQLACSREEAVRVIERSHEGTDGTSVINESLRNGLVMGETRLHFMHQAVQEYFAALRISTLISSTRGYLSAIGLKRQLRKRAKDDRWAEVIVQLAGLTGQPQLVAKQVLISNPWLAYWCSIEGKPLTAEMQAQIERQTVGRLDSAKVEARLRVVNELARMENPRTIGYLMAALSDVATPVQELAIQTLARLGEPSVDPLLDFLAHAGESARWAATRTLGTIWRFPEVARLGTEQSHARCLAAEVLGNLGDDRAVVPLIAALQDSVGIVRKSAAQALGRLGDVRAVAPLMNALEWSYAQARPGESSAIAEALATLGKPADEPLLAGLRDLDSTVRQRALIALGRTWRLPAIAELADDDAGTRRDAARRLGEMSPERAVEPLLAALKDREQSVRWEATRTLGRLWQFSTLIDLGSTDDLVRRVAARDLRRLPDPRTVEPLIAALQDRDSKVRKHATDALGALGKIAIEPLAILLRHNDREIRRSAGKALARIDDGKIVDVLAFAMHDGRSWVREAAAESLVELGDRGVPALEIALQSGDSAVCQLARFALRRIGTIRAQGALHLWRWRRSSK